MEKEEREEEKLVAIALANRRQELLRRNYGWLGAQRGVKQPELIPLHRAPQRDSGEQDMVGDDPQLKIVIDEIVNSFSPHLSLELLLYNVLGSNCKSASALVRFLVTHYSSNQVCDHIKDTLRNMVRWIVLQGFLPCSFVPWKMLRKARLGLYGRTAITNVVRVSGRGLISGVAGKASTGVSPMEAASEAMQEQAAHRRVLELLINVPMSRLADRLKRLMENSLPSDLTAVVCKLVGDWVCVEFERDTEIKVSIVSLWEVLKALEHGRCPVVPECSPSGCLAFYDPVTDMVTASVGGAVYEHASVWQGDTSGGTLCTLARKAYTRVKGFSELLDDTVRGLLISSSRRIYTSSGPSLQSSAVGRFADVMLSMRQDSTGAPSPRMPIDSITDLLLNDRRSEVLGIPPELLNDMLFRPSADQSTHKSACLSHNLSAMLISMVEDSKDSVLLKDFMRTLSRDPDGALSELKAQCDSFKDVRLIAAAEAAVKRMKAVNANVSESVKEPVTDLGPDVRLLCHYPSSVNIAQVEDILSVWTNFWRSTLSGFSHFNRRHNAIQYTSRNQGRELDSGSPSHVFHSILVNLLNTSGRTFADSLAGRRPDGSLAVNDIMLARDSLNPSAYGLLLANKMGLRLSDIRHESLGESRDIEEQGVTSAHTLRPVDRRDGVHYQRQDEASGDRVLPQWKYQEPCAYPGPLQPSVQGVRWSPYDRQCQGHNFYQKLNRPRRVDPHMNAGFPGHSNKLHFSSERR